MRVRPEGDRRGPSPVGPWSRFFCALFGSLWGLTLLFATGAPSAAAFRDVEFNGPNGLRVLVEERPGSPVLAGVLAFAVGARDEPPDLPRLRDVLLAALMAPGGAAARTRDRIESAGGSMDFQVGDDMVFFRVTLPQPDLASLVEAVALGGGLTEPLGSPDGGTLQSLAESALEPRGKVYWALRAAAYRGTPRAASPLAAFDTAARVSAAELENFRSRHLVARRAFLAIVGPVDARDVAEVIGQCFPNIPSGAPPSEPGPAPEPWLGRTVVPIPSRTAWIALGYLAPPGPSREAEEMAELILRVGEGNASLLCHALREEIGLTYWTGATWENGPDASLAILWAVCAPEDVEVVEGKMRQVLSDALFASTQSNPDRVRWRRDLRRALKDQRAADWARTWAEEKIEQELYRHRTMGGPGRDADGVPLTLWAGHLGSPIVVVGIPKDYE